jgi:flagellar export protein FliJ
MAFHFTLKALLRLRQSLELAELQKLQAIAADIARVRDEMKTVERQMNERRRALADLLVVGLTGAEWQFELAREASLLTLQSELMKNLADLEAKRIAQQASYVRAHRACEILLNLQERQLAAYKLEEARRTQQRVDELFIIRKVHNASSK